jgi:predicted nuclease of predicted toxin-antitoxin system
MIKCKLDEDLPASAMKGLLHGKGDITSVSDQNLCGTKDSELWGIVQKENRIFITADRGFGDIRHYPPGSHYGILLLRPDEEGIDPLIELIKGLVASYSLDDLKGAICVVSPRGIRIRRS